MDLVRTVLLYMMMLVGTATGVSPEVTPMPANALPTPTPYVTQAPTAVPATPSPRPTRYTTLYLNDKGNAVRALQNRLKELGYLTGNVDGTYGTKTKTAVEDFQRANGLKVDGIAGRATQQVLFESENVVYASAATLIPTVPPVTPTPVAPAQVAVRYMDVSTGALLRQITVSCYGDTNIYADASMVSASYRLVSNSYVSIRVSNGQATPSTVTFYYQHGATATPVSGVNVPIYYLDSTNLIIARETRTLYQSGAVAADVSLIPAGYSLTGSSVVYVTLSGGAANPSPILFRLNRDIATPSPTPLTGVVVPVRYVNASTNAVFQTQNITLYRSGTIYPQRSLVPEGWTLVSASSVNVTISNGRANPAAVTFRYQPYQPTATPIVSVTVPVYYIDTVTSRTVHSTTETLTSSRLVYASLNALPGYKIATGSASSVYVTVRNGQASPNAVTFRVTPTATPTPAPKTVAVPVRYLYGSRLEGSHTVYLTSGTTSYVYADSSYYNSSEFALSGADNVRVIVSASGVASPSVVTFYLTRRATPSPVPTAVPVYQVTVPVRYQYNSRTVFSDTVSIPSGTAKTIYADHELYGREYNLIGDYAVTVTVSQDGYANPSVVIFYVEPKQEPTSVPTAVPPSEVPVTVSYMLDGVEISRYQKMCRRDATTTVYADPDICRGYKLLSDSEVNVVVDREGHIDPETVTFFLTAPQPITPAPSFDVVVDVQYRYGNQLIASATEILQSGTTATVRCDSSMYGSEFVLSSSDRVTVTVGTDGYASPNPVIFYLDLRATAMPTIVPAPTVVPPAPGPSGDLNQELPAYATGSFSKSHDVYQGPGKEYYRSNRGKATYGGGGAARIYGTDGEWLLIGYELGSGDYRIGYIRDYTLPAKVDPSRVRPLTYAWIETTIAAESVVTDDPVINMKELEKLQPGTPVTFLAWASSKHRWALIEYQSPSLGLIRAFVKGANLACMK